VASAGESRVAPPKDPNRTWQHAERDYLRRIMLRERDLPGGAAPLLIAQTIRAALDGWRSGRGDHGDGAGSVERASRAVI